jgi:MFS transporter, DHA3 family, macrolide efflux protein
MNKPGSKSFGRFLIIWSGQLISSIGSGLTAFTLGVYAFEKTQSATVFSLIILFAFLPSYLLKPIGGALADRFDRRLMMIIGDLGSALGLVFILLMFLAGNYGMWVIYLGVAVSSSFDAMHNPAYKASVTDLVDEKIYTKASGLMQLADSSRFLISPVIAGFLIQFLAIEQILIIDITTFLIALILVFCVKKRVITAGINRHSESFIAGFVCGFRYTFSHKVIVGLLLITSAISFSVGFLQSLMGPMILAFSDAKTLGIVLSASSSGMISSSFLIGIFGKTTKKVKILSIALAFAGLFYALFGTSTNIHFLIAFGFLFFSALPFVNTSLDVLIRKNVDNQMQGRVWSIVSLISQLGLVVAFSAAGLLADTVFNPLLQPGGLLSSSVGRILGTNPGRGIGLMFILSGIFMTAISSLVWKSKSLRKLE